MSVADHERRGGRADLNPLDPGSQLDKLRKSAQNLNFYFDFPTLPMVLRGALLRRVSQVAHYALIAVAAWAAAVVVVKAAALDLHPTLEVTAATPDAPGPAESSSRRREDDARILRRNLFGAAPLEEAEEAAPASTPTELRLRGVAISESGSFALFENLASSQQNVFAVGEKVFDGPRLVAVDAAGAVVTFKNKKQRYELAQEATSPAAGDTSKDPKAPARDKAGRGDKSGGVRKTGESSYLVDRREVDYAVSNLNEVITQVRAVPVLKDGQSIGFKLFNIRGGSIFEKIGLHDGDIVQKVNDKDLSDPSRAIGLLEEVQSMSQIRVNFLRGGKPHSNTYTVQ
ncbi:MAG: hypothetical protein HY899_08880 [Deltaproteobacteria bacterium]|nr:hypothetical protein [Deltaproteobacteria bacterium]